ncbi:hypothetical protein F5J12DRAFT_804284 [Pisolithus orientalis]|uniref:uncharacterized protein n=1 Tax=Pisolithus orientalis TaxID=936130 RepID=UPI002224A0B2|nr:uncharacterized protein F5J12DRAFT_804284 [Pisolithus orientalis]KAI6028286.1 hypothetical protein F5J12DRAFT_804284 [Pisolithus orientalis]
MSPLSPAPLAHPSAGSHLVLPHYFATSSSLSTTVLTPASTAVCGTSAGLFVAVVALLSWKWRCWDQGAPREQPRHRRVLTKKAKPPSSEAEMASASSATTNTCRPIVTDAATTDKDQSVDAATVIHPTLPSRFPPAVHLHRGLSYKASTITSSSVYSTQSGEEHQVQVPPSVIVAALGPHLEQGLSADYQGLALTRRPTYGSSQLAAISKTPNEAGLSPQMNRLSHLSAESLYLNMQLVDPALMTVPIGLAYGGE